MEKHARWWNRKNGRGVKYIKITQAEYENVAADALSRIPKDHAPKCGITQEKTQVAVVREFKKNASSDVSSVKADRLLSRAS